MLPGILLSCRFKGLITANATWMFPDPSTHFMLRPHDVFGPTSVDRILCHRFKLVREDLEAVLVGEVNVAVGELQKAGYALV
jgi:hypothetical protein